MFFYSFIDPYLIADQKIKFSDDFNEISNRDDFQPMFPTEVIPDEDAQNVNSGPQDVLIDLNLGSESDVGGIAIPMSYQNDQFFQSLNFSDASQNGITTASDFEFTPGSRVRRETSTKIPKSSQYRSDGASKTLIDDFFTAPKIDVISENHQENSKNLKSSGAHYNILAGSSDGYGKTIGEPQSSMITEKFLTNDENLNILQRTENSKQAGNKIGTSITFTQEDSKLEDRNFLPPPLTPHPKVAQKISLEKSSQENSSGSFTETSENLQNNSIRTGRSSDYSNLESENTKNDQGSDCWDPQNQSASFNQPPLTPHPKVSYSLETEQNFFTSKKRSDEKTSDFENTLSKPVNIETNRKSSNTMKSSVEFVKESTLENKGLLENSPRIAVTKMIFAEKQKIIENWVSQLSTEKEFKLLTFEAYHRWLKQNKG